MPQQVKAFEGLEDSCAHGHGARSTAGEGDGDINMFEGPSFRRRKLVVVCHGVVRVAKASIDDRVNLGVGASVMVWSLEDIDEFPKKKNVTACGRCEGRESPQR